MDHLPHLKGIINGKSAIFTAHKILEVDAIFQKGTRYKALFVSLLLSAIGFGLYKGVIDNYLAEVAQMTEMDRGIAEFFRELPGLLLVVVLALFYGADAGVISLLFAVSAIACFIFSPLVGKLIDRVGYKPVMIADTLILVIVCFFYGFAHHIFPMRTAFIICCVNYVLDSVISLASMASNVYVQDISDSQEEMKATISTGISVNHLITVLIALLGGWVWKVLGIETLFMLSAFLGLCNSAYAATIRTSRDRS